MLIASPTGALEIGRRVPQLRAHARNRMTSTVCSSLFTRCACTTSPSQLGAKPPFTSQGLCGPLSPSKLLQLLHKPLSPHPLVTLVTGDRLVICPVVASEDRAQRQTKPRKDCAYTVRAFATNRSGIRRFLARPYELLWLPQDIAPSKDRKQKASKLGLEGK